MGQISIGSNRSDGGKIGANVGVKPAYKTSFEPIFTSDGQPMLPWRFFRTRRGAVWAVTIKTKKKWIKNMTS